ncbi:MAG: 2-oxo acid dehydrogenase subunit E2 [Kiritimatiellae bacterium]|nr:2-oxo acid dehydrogenase subunit E2 [Kiritimatiellia bacterium]
MAIEIKLPELGENISEGDIVNILVSEGDTVTVDQPLLEIETGKATVEVPAPQAGVIGKIHVSEGDKASVGTVIVTLEAGDSSPAAAEPPAQEEKKPEPAPAPKAAEEAPAPAPAPTPSAKPAKKAAVPSRPAPAPVAVALPSSNLAPASPSTRQFAREVGVDINQIEGTGPGGRVSIEDVKAFSRAAQAGTARPAGGVAAAPLPDFGKWGDVEVEEINTIREVTAQHMAASWNTIPHVTIHEKIDLTALEALRKASKSKAEAAGVKLTLTAFLIKIAASGLKLFPRFNAALDLVNHQMIYRKYYNIGVAVDTDKGLLVPVLRNVDQMNVIQIAKSLGAIADKAKARRISPDDLQGGCFTITNIGGIAGGFFTPIVNYPEVAILGVGRAAMEPVMIDGLFQPRLMLPLSLSFDHRVIDGADGARFIKWLNEAIQQPVLISLEG